MSYKSVVLVVLDGWGDGPAWGGNAIAQATTPTVDWLGKQPTALLSASGQAVGLAENEIGSSEVGHINLGAGRVVQQESTAISALIASREFFRHPPLLQRLREITEHRGRLHLIGLLSRASVHSNRSHLSALLEVISAERIADVRLHLITDGRDSDPRDALGQLIDLELELAKYPSVKIQSVMGRYYAMDRDHHWERTQQAFSVIAFGQGSRVGNPRLAITQSYSQSITDEFIVPHVIEQPGNPYRGIVEHDALLFWNFRPDRMRQIVRSFADPAFSAFPRPKLPDNFHVATLTNYSAEEHIPGIEPIIVPSPVIHPLAEMISDSGAHQFHVAETEKYGHITYFFNGGREEPFPGEERLLVPSPAVATYDTTPAMAADKITSAIISRLGDRANRLMVANYANADMVGHTGNFQATLLAVESIDKELRRLIEACQKMGVPLIVTADHGNAEEMVDPRTGEPATKHTANLVPCHVILPDQSIAIRQRGILADVAPTVLELLGLTQPPEMTGQSLIEVKPH